MDFTVWYDVRFDTSDEPEKLARQCNLHGRETLCPLSSFYNYCPFRMPCEFVTAKDWRRMKEQAPHD